MTPLIGIAPALEKRAPLGTEGLICGLHFIEKIGLRFPGSDKRKEYRTRMNELPETRIRLGTHTNKHEPRL